MIDAPSAPAPLSSAPGAKAAKLCGIWSIIASATCVGIPIGIALAIIALVQQAKAKRLARESPEFYEMPTATGLITGILGLAMPVVMLPFLGIVSAIAIPALLSQRSRARDKAAMMNMITRTGDLVGQCDKLSEAKTPPDQIPAALEAYLQQAGSADKNPWNIAAPAFNAHIEVVSNLDRDEVGQMAEAQATELGQAVWVIELPKSDPFAGVATPLDPRVRSGMILGYLAGAVRTQNPVNGSVTVTKVVEIE